MNFGLRQNQVSHTIKLLALSHTLVDKSLRTEFQAKGNMGVFVGYNDTSKGWRFRNPSTNMILEGSDMILNEVTSYSSPSFTKNQATTVDSPISLLASSEAHRSTSPMVSNNIIPTASLRRLESSRVSVSSNVSAMSWSRHKLRY